MASQAREHQVLVERSFHGAGVGDAQNRVGWLDVISDTEARFPLRGLGDAIVLVDAQTEIEGPVVDIDCVLNVECEFPDVGMAENICTRVLVLFGQPSEAGSGAVLVRS